MEECNQSGNKESDQNLSGQDVRFIHAFGLEAHLFAGSKELECNHGIAGVKIRMAVGVAKTFAWFSSSS
jgi:hypothetical protein